MTKRLTIKADPMHRETQEEENDIGESGFDQVNLISTLRGLGCGRKVVVCIICPASFKK
jgi:hypothetical protein